MDYNNVFQLMKHEKVPYINEVLSHQKNLYSPINTKYINELKELSSKTYFKDKSLLFYKALLYYDIIMNQASKPQNLSLSQSLNYDLIVLNAFYLSMKFTQNQINMPRLSQMKYINKKYSTINPDSFLANEIICLKLMNYSLVYSSSYDFLLLTLHDKPNVFDKAKEYLDKYIYCKESVCYSPYSIACVIINYTMSVLGLRDPLLMKRFYVEKKSPCYLTIVK